jgi:hypothetical protein
MTNEELLREFVALPPEGRRVITDLIAFLRQRYGAPPTTTSSAAADLSSESFIGMWSDREEMQDSSAWVRTVRKSERRLYDTNT